MSINYFRNTAETESYTTGQNIFSEGDPCNVMYAVIEGEVDIVFGERILETVVSGGIFGEMALVSEQPRSASAIARTDCKVAPVDEKRFTYMVQQTPYFALQVMRVMAERLRRETALK
jgi:CRP/FNR family transcriptional regulator, cyclic AMP receptor protein